MFDYKLLIFLLFLPSILWAKPMDKVIAFYRDKPAITADFQQTVTVKSPHRVLKRKGRVYFKRPGRMRWDYKWPDEVYYVSDGTTFWAYDVDEEVVYRSSVKHNSLFSALKILFDFKEIYNSFKCETISSDKNVTVVKMTPKKQLPLRSLSLTFDTASGRVIKTTVVDNLGNPSVVEFKNQVFKEIPDRAFEFKVPKGIPVQDLDKKTK